MANEDLISILMPVRNAGKYLVPCLDSIMVQSHTNWELIAINNQSTDGTEEILNQYSKKDARIKTITNPGIPEIIPALSLAYSHARGSFITRMDADDLMAENKLEALHTSLLSSGKNHVATGLVHYFNEESPLGEGYQSYEEWLNNLTKQEKNFEDIYRECVIPSPCWMVRRSDLDQIGGFLAERYPEDYDLCFRLYEHGFKVVGVNSVLHFWRDYQNRNSRTDPRYKNALFFKLKLHYFFKIDRDSSKSLIVWGAGNKGKQLVKLLSEYEENFEWLTNNQKKSGQDIYGKVLQDEATVFHKDSPCQIILAVSSKNHDDIIKQLSDSGHQLFIFS